MKIRAIQRAAVDTYLKLVRLPFDTAIGMFPGGTGVRPVAKAAVDGADAGVRAIVAMVLGDPVSVGDATRQRGHGDREGRHDGRGHESKEPRARHSKEQQDRVKEKRGRMRHKPAPAGQQAAAAEPPTAPPARQAAPGTRARAAEITGTAGRTAARTAGSGTRRRAPNIVPAEHQAPPASADKAPSEPSHEEIATRAYELYECGVPGDAHTHWEAAQRELTSASR